MGSIDTPKLIVTVDDVECRAALSVSFVAHPVGNAPEGLWFAIAPTSSNSVVVVPAENGVDDMSFDAGDETICQNSIAPDSGGSCTPGSKKNTNIVIFEMSLPLMPVNVKANLVPDWSLGIKSVRTTPPGMRTPRT